MEGNAHTDTMDMDKSEGQILAEKDCGVDKSPIEGLALTSASSHDQSIDQEVISSASQKR